MNLKSFTFGISCQFYKIYWSGIFVIFLIITVLRSDENTGRKLFFDKHPLLCAYVWTCMSVNLRLDIPVFLPPPLNKRQHPSLKCQVTCSTCPSLPGKTKSATNCIISFNIYFFIKTYTVYILIFYIVYDFWSYLLITC